jgi:hypothetical protein
MIRPHLPLTLSFPVSFLLIAPSFSGAGFAQRVDDPAANKGDHKRSTATAEPA